MQWSVHGDLVSSEFWGTSSLLVSNALPSAEAISLGWVSAFPVAGVLELLVKLILQRRESNQRNWHKKLKDSKGHWQLS